MVPCQHFAASGLLAAEVVRQVLRMRSCSDPCVRRALTGSHKPCSSVVGLEIGLGLKTVPETTF